MTTIHKTSPLELKLDAPLREIQGYASVFDVVDAYGDRVIAGAFRASLRRRRPLMLWQHGTESPVGVWLDVHEDDRGLYVRGRLSDTTTGRDAYTLARDGAFSGLSIGFRIPSGGAIDGPAPALRTIREVELVEISLVSLPANEAARITDVRAATPLSLDQQLARLRGELVWRQFSLQRAIAANTLATLAARERP